MKKYCISQNNFKDADKEEDAFYWPEGICLYMMMTQTKDKLFHQLK